MQEYHAIRRRTVSNVGFWTDLGVKVLDLSVLAIADLLDGFKPGPEELLVAGRLDGVHQALAIIELLLTTVFPEVGNGL